MKKYEPIFIKGSIDLTLKKAIFDIVKALLHKAILEGFFSNIISR